MLEFIEVTIRKCNQYVSRESMYSNDKCLLAVHYANLTHNVQNLMHVAWHVYDCDH